MGHGNWSIEKKTLDENCAAELTRYLTAGQRPVKCLYNIGPVDKTACFAVYITGCTLYLIIRARKYVYGVALVTAENGEMKFVNKHGYSADQFKCYKYTDSEKVYKEIMRVCAILRATAGDTE